MQRLLSPLSNIGFALVITLTCVVASHAAILKDIRVGEYDDHTRIVLELSETTPIERIMPRDPGQLAIIFSDTQPQLNRKIPIENTRRVKNFKLWQRKESLSLLLTFSFDHFRYELTNYKDPVRIALDVYELPSAAAKPNALEKPLSKASVPGAFTASDQLAVLPDTPLPAEPSLPADETIQTPSAKFTDVSPRNESPADEPIKAIVPEQVTSEAKPHPTSSAPEAVEASDSQESPTAGFSSMQSFLVVGLLIITIVILVLLLMMLLSKHRWAEDTTPLSANESHKKQDERIAAINAKVHEQLKRYDEA